MLYSLFCSALVLRRTTSTNFLTKTIKIRDLLVSAFTYVNAPKPLVGKCTLLVLDAPKPLVMHLHLRASRASAIVLSVAIQSLKTLYEQNKHFEKVLTK